MAATLGLFRVPDPQTRGVVELDSAGIVVGFTEKPERPKSNLAWAGLLVATPQVWAAIPEQTPCDLGHDVLPRLVGRMRGFEIEGYHQDVGTPESYRQACSDLGSLGSAA
jgi:mannose-1-phosphate guanylyltransferase